jgi:ribosomal protein S18 acetylase RimI-like enzyme
LGKQRLAIAVGRKKRLDGASSERFKDIYLKSFPPSSRASLQKLLGGISEGDRWLFAARWDGGVVGFALTMPLPGTGAHYLEYLAVAPRFRNRGVGSRLLASVRRKLSREDDASGLIFEVKPDDSPRPRENGLRRRRIEFYRRNGARPVECAPHYRAPDLAGEGAIGYRLMWLPLRQEAETPCGGALKKLIRGIFVHAYGRRRDDALLKAVLRDVLRLPRKAGVRRENIPPEGGMSEP